MSPFHRWFNNRRVARIRERGGWYLIGGRTYFFKSRYEVLVACHWQFMQEIGVINSWWYEPYTFQFSKTRGITNYTPDFEIHFKPGGVGANRNLMVECKGWVSTKDVRRIRQFKKDYPDCRLMLMVQNLKRFVRSLQRRAGEDVRAADEVLTALKDWDKGEKRGMVGVSVCDWTEIQKKNRYGTGLFARATPVEKPIGGCGYNKRQKINLCKAYRLPHEDPQENQQPDPNPDPSPSSICQPAP